MSQPVFLHYDKAALDREYDNRAKVANFAEHLNRWNTLSERARAELSPRLNVSYGPSAEETLDIFPVPGNTNAPIQVFFHGGYWKALHKNDFNYVAFAMQPVGAVTVVVNYALMPSVSMAELIRQCRASLAWIWRNAENISGDRERIYISGHSAGGHIIAMMLTTDWPSFSAGLPTDLVKGACGISGLYDLEPIQCCYLNDDLQMSLDEAKAHSPVLLPCRNPCPLLLPLGGLEGPEYLRQSETLAQHWQVNSELPKVWVMEGLDHFSIAAQLEMPESELSCAIHDQMGI